MNGRFGWFGWAAMVVLAFGATGTAAAQGADRVAVVDIREVLERLDERTSVEARARQAQQEAKAEETRRLDAINAIRTELPMLDGDALRAKEDEIVLLQSELDAYISVQVNKIQRDAAALIEGMRKKMEAAVESIAKERGIQLVMTRAIQMTVPGPDGRPRAVPTPQVIWAAPEADITDAVVDRMNADFARQSALPSRPEADVALARAEESTP